MRIEDIARVCHEANRAYCLVLGDNSQLSWEDSPDWQRNSCISGVKSHLRLLPNSYPRPSYSHSCWMIEKVADGWKLGPVKDPVKKEHPCMIPYNELPESQKAKDKIFASIVASIYDSLQPYEQVELLGGL